MHDPIYVYRAWTHDLRLNRHAQPLYLYLLHSPFKLSAFALDPVQCILSIAFQQGHLKQTGSARFCHVDFKDKLQQVNQLKLLSTYNKLHLVHEISLGIQLGLGQKCGMRCFILFNLLCISPHELKHKNNHQMRPHSTNQLNQPTNLSLIHI